MHSYVSSCFYRPGSIALSRLNSVVQFLTSGSRHALGGQLLHLCTLSMWAAVFSPPCFCAPTIRAPPCLVSVEVIPDFSCGMVLDPLPEASRVCNVQFLTLTAGKQRALFEITACGCMMGDGQVCCGLERSRCHCAYISEARHGRFGVVGQGE